MDMVHDGVAHEHHRHGSLGGHVLPGAFFIIWSVWWYINMASIYIHRAQRKKAYAAQPHYRLSVAPTFPFEAVIKISLCTVGILGELYLSHHAHWRCATCQRQCYNRLSFTRVGMAASDVRRCIRRVTAALSLMS